MAEPKKCSSCGAVLPPNAPGGHCLKCLFQFGLETGDSSTEPALLLEPTALKESGDRIGRYKLLQQIGEGGCGVVYLAEQEEPVRRRVALKILKLGMDTKQVIARFEAERQTLALMDHPNIAKILDAGVTGTGRPYFVMELVRGLKITDYCDHHRLSTRQRLNLFILVCQAIQHAHQKGIIHRDIKPSNILVTEQDGEAVPRIIDFGIAKATTGQRLTDKTLFTVFEQFIGTPAYMSPEQAGLGGLDIDTRSDIYSLGVLLYELLTGRPPFDSQMLHRGVLDEILKTIREKEPPRPSTKLSTLTHLELTTIAHHRQTEPGRLPHLLRGDLDWVVIKALEKDRARRYETANGLARDLQRHLDNEPVVARPPGNFYRFQKLARRNKLAFGAAMAIAVSLLIGIGISTVMYLGERAARQQAVAAEQEQARLRRQAQDEEKQAQTEAAKSRQVAQFLGDMLKGVGPSVALGRDTKLLRDILDKTAERIGTELTNQPPVEVELLDIVGDVYAQIGEFRDAEAMDRASLALRQKWWGKEGPDVANVLHNLASFLQQQGKYTEAETAEREALAMRKKLLGNENLDVATSLLGLGRILIVQGEYDEADPILREALAMQKKLLGNENSDVAMSLDALATMYQGQRRFAQAETMEREVLAVRKKLFGNENLDVAASLDALATMLQDQRKFDEAETMEREALAAQKKLLGNEHPYVAKSLNNLATMLVGQGRYAEAETTQREALATQKKLLGNEHPYVAISLYNLDMILKAQGKFTEAETVEREALAMYVGLLGNAHPNVTAWLNTLVDTLMREHKYDQAGQVFGAVLTPAFMNKPQSAGLLQSRAQVFARNGRWAAAAADLTRAIAFNPSNHMDYHSLAPLLAASGDVENYRRCCREIIASFGSTGDTFIADKMAKDCSILPSSGANPDIVSRLADIAVAAGSSNAFFAYFQCTKGLAEYRRGRFASAADWMGKTVDIGNHKERHQWDDFLYIEAYAVLAMAQWQLNENDEAGSSLAKGTEAEAKLAKLEGGDIGATWRDWITAHVLMDEARQLINGQKVESAAWNQKLQGTNSPLGNGPTNIIQ